MLKRLLFAAAIAAAIGATSLPAQLYGPWAGSGKGSCTLPDGSVIYPWQDWYGILRQDSDVFSGTWRDTVTGNKGTFKGSNVAVGPMTVICKGVWTWAGTDSDDSAPVEMGAFMMNFYGDEGKCSGEWSSYSSVSADQGRMYGYWVGE
jgi:hypothetical protein